MTINKLLNEGRPNRSKLEKAADGILALPRKIWMGKNVKIIKDAEGANKISHKQKNPLIRTSFLICLLCPLFNLILVPMFIVGAILKKISFVKDKKANAHAKIVDDVWKKERLETQKKSISKFIDSHAECIGNLQDIIDFIKEKPIRRDAFLIKNPEVVLHEQEKAREYWEKRLVKTDEAMVKVTDRLNAKLMEYKQ